MLPTVHRSVRFRSAGLSVLTAFYLFIHAGPVLEGLNEVLASIEIEMNSATDNPLILVPGASPSLPLPPPSPKADGKTPNLGKVRSFCIRHASSPIR